MGLSFERFQYVSHYRFFGPSRRLAPDPRLREHERSVEDALQGFRIVRRELLVEDAEVEPPPEIPAQF